MHIGDKYFYLNSNNKIETLIVVDISRESDSVRFEGIDENSKIVIHMRKLSDVKKDRRYSTNYSDVFKYKDELMDNYYDRILRDALNSVTLDEVARFGSKLRSKQIFVRPELYTIRSELYTYKEKLYVAVYRISEYNNKKKCILFKEVKKED